MDLSAPIAFVTAFLGVILFAALGLVRSELESFGQGEDENDPLA